MGKFNFDQKDQQSRFNTFTPIEITKRAGGGQRIEKPIVSLGSGQIRFGSFFSEELQKNRYTHARFMLSKNMLAMQFLTEEVPDSLKLRSTTKSTALTASFTSVANYLMEETDLVNFNVYNYQFDIKHDEKNVYFIELDQPWRKTKKKK
ncbi:hypothetical protein I6N96_01200 [Enterococcus sp. BWM-S5]|uniref:Uncharacterized protein n=1 Tax=Enterococcus larvae TaxID=2794352 RepID=A0ABS4CER3_9ENTE|nr:hypothetical protein [Enterococcus larvae]MBP1044878.1 hypothetical protein [Enterococcus larvae]